MSTKFQNRLRALQHEQAKLFGRTNLKEPLGNGIYERYQYPILTAGHTPLLWRYDLDENTNPLLLERIGINAVFNAGALKKEDKYYLMARVEGDDRKSFFAIAESTN